MSNSQAPQVFLANTPASLTRKVEALMRRCGQAGPCTRDIGLGLEQALGLLQSRDNPTRPYTVVFLGGTGVGKSRMFSRLVGREGASPRSDAERNHTRVPHAACSPDRRPLVGLPEEVSVQWVDWDRESLVLIDTPDIDGMVLANRQVTRLTLAIADLVVFVTSPDKLANAVPYEALREWSPRTRWMFVLNKSDLVSNPTANARDWATRLEALGFDQPSILLTNADSPADPGIALLASKLFENRGPQKLNLLRHEAFLRVAARALHPDRLALLQSTRQILRQRGQELAAEMHQALVEGLRGTEASEAFRGILREATWQKLPGSAGPLLFLPIWIRCRFLSLLTGYQMSRLALAGPTLLGVGILGMGAATSLFRSLGPLRRVVEALGEGYRIRLNQVRQDARNTLEDFGLSISTGPAQEVEKAPIDAPPWLEWLGDKLKGFALRGADETVLENLDSDVQKASSHLARSLWSSPTGWLAWLLGNGMPALMGGWVVYRAGLGWFQQTYPDWNFLVVATLLWLVSFLPGFGLVALAVWSRTGRIDVPGLVHSTREPLVIEPLTRAANDLDHMENEVNRLRIELNSTLQSMDSGGEDGVGMRVRD